MSRLIHGQPIAPRVLISLSAVSLKNCINLMANGLSAKKYLHFVLQFRKLLSTSSRLWRLVCSNRKSITPVDSWLSILMSTLNTLSARNLMCLYLCQNSFNTTVMYAECSQNCRHIMTLWLRISARISSDCRFVT